MNSGIRLQAFRMICLKTQGYKFLGTCKGLKSTKKKCFTLQHRDHCDHGVGKSVFTQLRVHENVGESDEHRVVEIS